MAYIRTRRKGNYIYKELVKTVYIDGKPTQKFLKYLGKAEITKIKPNLTKEDVKKINNVKERYNKKFKKLSKSIREKFVKSFLIKFTYNTNRIEGSTLTLKETSLILKDKIAPKGASTKEVKEAENHEKAFDFMYDYNGDIDLKFILKLHKILLGGIDDEIAGKLRDFDVAIDGTVFKPPHFQELNYELKEFLRWYNKAKRKINAFELACLVHLKLVTIHPFGDGNGRIARLLQNFVLKRNKYPLLDIPYKDREKYYDSLENCQINKTQKAFIDYLKREYFKEYEL